MGGNCGLCKVSVVAHVCVPGLDKFLHVDYE